MLLGFSARVAVNRGAFFALQQLASLLLSEALSAHLLGFPVSTERIGPRELFAAWLADVRALSGVRPLMALEIVLARKAAAAFGADKRLVVTVGAKVGTQIVDSVLGENAPTAGIGANCIRRSNGCAATTSAPTAFSDRR